MRTLKYIRPVRHFESYGNHEEGVLEALRYAEDKECRVDLRICPPGLEPFTMYISPRHVFDDLVKSLLVRLITARKVPATMPKKQPKKKGGEA